MVSVRPVTSSQPIPFPGRAQVHVWVVGLDLDAPDRERVSRWLSEEERARAGRFRQARDRRRFVAARGQLRGLLGSYLEVHPPLLRLTASPWGKPALATGSPGEGLEFSVSHADEKALFAVAHDRQVGVDIERLRGNLDIVRMARLALSEREQERLRGLDVEARTAAFFAAWTRREASVKARGIGLAGRREDAFSPGWGVQDLTPGPGYVGAVAARGHDWEATIRGLRALWCPRAQRVPLRHGEGI
jgi:4'-phosphopantetheinyl transferase